MFKVHLNTVILFIFKLFVSFSKFNNFTVDNHWSVFMTHSYLIKRLDKPRLVKMIGLIGEDLNLQENTNMPICNMHLQVVLSEKTCH